MRSSPPLRRLSLPAVVLAVLLAAVSLAAVPAKSPALYAEGVRLGADGRPQDLPVGSSLQDAGPTWAGAVPGQGTRWEDMARRAMADLDVLTVPADLDDDPATAELAALAGWRPLWRYVWPRDSSFVTAALSVSGRTDDAEAVLRHVQGLQAADGTFQARYRVDGSVPDDRGEQLDGVGWVLWATWVWVESLRAQGVPEDAVGARLEGLRPLVTRSAALAAASVDPGTGLPPPSMDYWEIELDETSQGTAAPVLVGLRAAGQLLPLLDETDLTAQVADTEARLTTGIADTFGSRGYPRLLSTGRADASVAFLMPPFTEQPEGQQDAWVRARGVLTAPNGGLRPGEEFHKPWLAWTPQTALFAMTAAATGDTRTAHELLDWLDARRTRVGSLPEKVDENGRPAAVAPLTWTASLVLLTLAALEGDLPAPPPA
ncbi:glycoside hydrolase family 15 protein [Thalassiella azotivora]